MDRPLVENVLVAQKHFSINSWDNRLRTFDFDGNELGEREIPAGNEDDAHAYAELDPQGTRLLVSRGGWIRLLDASTLELPPSASSIDTWQRQWHAGGNLITAHFSPDGRRIAARDDRGTISIWNLDGELLDVIRGHSRYGQVSWSPDGKELVAACGRRNDRAAKRKYTSDL